MSGLIGKGAAYLLTAGILFTTGMLLGHRLTRDHYRGVMAVERQQLTEASARIQIEAEHKVIDTERKDAAKMAEIDQHYQKELQYEKAKHRRTLAERDTARRRLYIGIKPTFRDRDRLSSTTPTPGSNHDPQRAELSATAARFLVGEAHRADQIVRQLTACQRVIEVEREVFAGENASEH
jgi:prophage endopeptidase